LKERLICCIARRLEDGANHDIREALFNVVECG
jgi:hypothetical protein